MKELFFSELRRFRTLALLAAVVHLMVLVAVTQMLDLPQQRRQLHAIVAIFYMVASVGFALYHFGSYRSPGRWAWLMHRPLSPLRIFGAIAGASFVLLLGVVAVPILLTLAGSSEFGGRVVDLRHYLAVVHIVLLCFASWLAGGYIMLNHRRSAVVILILPVAVFFDLGSGFAMLLPELLCVALLAYILSGVFKPNHAAPPAGAARLVTTALPLLLCFYLVALWGGSTLFQWGQIIAGTHPLNGKGPQPDGFVSAVRMDPLPRMMAGLAPLANSDEGKVLAARVALAPTVTSYHADAERYAVRHQSSNAENLMWPDPTSRTIWSFSHDDMRYRGRSMVDQSPAGYFGAGGKGSEQPFTEVPMEESGYLLTPHTLYRIVDGTSLETTFTTQGNEQIVMAPDDMGRAKGRVPPRYRYVLTNARLVALDPRSNALQFSVPLPAAFSDLAVVDVAEVGRETLVSFLFGDDMAEGIVESDQVLMLAAPGVAPRQVAARPLRHDFAMLFEHRDFWLSPALNIVASAPEALIDDGTVPDVMARRIERNGTVWAATVIAALLSAIAGAAWLARTSASPRRKLGWIAACLLLGIPALLTLMALQPRIRRVVPAAWPAAVAQAA